VQCSECDLEQEVNFKEHFLFDHQFNFIIHNHIVKYA
jgi:hypothetical protein